VQRKCASGGGIQCEECARKTKLDLRRRAISDIADSSVPSVVEEVLLSSGDPLDRLTRTFMEERLGHDFASVQVHSNDRAAESAAAVNALAYTVGDHVVFGRGHYAPASQAGRQLLAHELTHVIQQDGIASTVSKFSDLRLGNTDDDAEREADTRARQIVDMGRAEAPRLRSAEPVINRQSDDRQTTGGGLPYREATQLAECMKIMGPDSSEYCRREVLGEEPIPATDETPAARVGNTAVTQPAETTVQNAKQKEANEEKKGIEYTGTGAIETETKKDDGTIKTEFAPKYNFEAAIPFIDKRIGPFSIAKEISTAVGGPFNLTQVEWETTVKVLSMEIENVKAPLGLGYLSLGVGSSAIANVGYDFSKNSDAAHFGFGAGGEAKYSRTKESPFFIKVEGSVEKTYDQEGNAHFAWGPLTFKTSLSIGFTFGSK
jgi:hypothetical protein